MGYKRDELRLDRLERGRQAMSNSMRPVTNRGTTRGGTLGSPLSSLSPGGYRDDLRTPVSIVEISPQ